MCRFFGGKIVGLRKNNFIAPAAAVLCFEIYAFTLKVCGCYLGRSSMFSNFYRFDLHNQNLCCTGTSTIKHQQEIWDLLFLSFSYGYRKCVFVCCLSKYILNIYILPILFTAIECGVVGRIRRRTPISFLTMSLWCLFFDHHLITYPHGVQLRKGTK